MSTGSAPYQHNTLPGGLRPDTRWLRVVAGLRGVARHVGPPGSEKGFVGADVKRHPLAYPSPMPSRHLHTGLIAAGVLLTTNGPLLFFAGRILDRPGTPPPWEDVAVRPVLIGFAVVASVLVLSRGRDGALATLRRAHRGVAAAVIGFPILALVSTAWSEQPEVTSWRAAVYLGLALFALAVADSDDRQLVQILVLVAAPAVAASAAVALLRPSVGLDRNDYWQGIYTNPNSLGPIAALGLIATVGAWGLTRSRVGRSFVTATGAMSALALYMSTSRTAWFALAVACGVATLVVGFRHARARVGAAAATSGAVLAATAGAISVVLILWSRWDDPTFSQRRVIWRGAGGYIEERWVHGYGFFSFFEVPGRAFEQQFFDRGSAHSSVVESLLGLGVIGLAVFLVIAGAAITNALKGAWTRPGAAQWVWLATVTFLLVENLTESFVLWFSYNWVLLCAAAIRRPSGAGHGRDPGEGPDSHAIRSPDLVDQPRRDEQAQRALITTESQRGDDPPG